MKMKIDGLPECYIPSGRTSRVDFDFQPCHRLPLFLEDAYDVYPTATAKRCQQSLHGSEACSTAALIDGDIHPQGMSALVRDIETIVRISEGSTYEGHWSRF